MMRLDRLLNVDDVKRVARKRVPGMFFEYADSGSYSEATYHDNTADFRQIRLAQRIGVDIERRSLKTTILGETIAMPIGLAPAGSAGMQIADGEIKAAQAAEEFGVPFVLSTVSICSIEDVAAATGRPFWFQLYFRKDRAFNERLIARAKAARCAALVITMDCQLGALRYKDVRNGLQVPFRLTPKFMLELATKPGWALGMLRTHRHSFGNFEGHVHGVSGVAALTKWMSEQDELSLSWDDVRWVKDRFGGPVVVKGVLHPVDAIEALRHGADAIIVSNHGGRQLDGAPSTIRVLPRIAEAVGDRAEVYLDSGVRSGQDVIKAIALGAKAVFVGRPFLYGLGAAGRVGVTRVLEILRSEADVTLGLMGEKDIRALGRHNVDFNGLEPVGEPPAG